MKNNIIYTIISFLLILTSCGSNRIINNNEMIKSSSKKYFMKASFNTNKDDKTKYLCLVIHLYNYDKQEIDKYQTGASDRMKWALGWLKEDDIIVMYSSDIGILAWKIENNKLLFIDMINDKIKKRGIELKAKKYGG